MKAVRPDIAALEQSGITSVALDRLNDPNVIQLWFGEGDEVTPAFVRDSAKQALDDGHTFYVHTRGLEELREEIRTYLNNLYDVSLASDRISVPGATMLCVAIAAQMSLRPGDDALIVSPHWPNIETCCRVAGANIITVRQRQTSEGWELTADEIIAAATPQTRCLFVNSPCNPTGWVMSADEQKLLLSYCRENNILLIADEVYHRHYYQGAAAPSFLQVARDDDPLVVVNGFSKAWAMTGWRVGWVVAPGEQALSWAILSECFNTGATVFAQHAGITALREGEATVNRLKAQYALGRDLVMSAFADNPHIELSEPMGAFYAFPKIRNMTSSKSFAARLLEETDVGVAPGFTFGEGNDRHIRICFAVSHRRLEEALQRINRFVLDNHNSL